MALTALPSDCLLACLARVPYADLRNGIPSTCKTLRDAVTSAAFRKTREAAGWTEWAVFASECGADTTRCCLITASGAHRTARRSFTSGDFVMRVSLSSSSDEVIAIDCNPSMVACAFDPRWNQWRQIPPLVREEPLSLNSDVAIGSIGSSILVLGGGGGDSMRAFDVFDVSQRAWSRQPPLPFESSYSLVVEVGGKMVCCASDAHLQETFIYDPETRSWTAGPRLPLELYDRDRGVHWHTNAFDLHGKLCIMAYFEYPLGTVKYSAFVWDPARETWDPAPFPVPPVVGFECSHIDGYLIACGNHPSHASPEFDAPEAARLFVLSPGSTEWTEWRLPHDVMHLATRITAVRLG